MRPCRNGLTCVWIFMALCALAPRTHAATSCTRPTSNTGTGLYVGCGRINNPGGSELRLRGVVRVHFDVPAASFIANTKANVVRTFYPAESAALGSFRADFQALLARGLTPVASMDSYAGTLASCRTEPGLLAGQLSRWVRDAATWTLLNAQGMIDLSSEWNPSSPSVWRSQTIAALKTLRTAGYTLPVMIDSGSCSRNQASFLGLAAEIAAADPSHNVIFWYKVDGNTASSAAMHTQLTALAAMSTANPQLAFVTGVFGPGSNLPPSAVLITPDDVIATAETNQLGWLLWSWDNSDQAGCVADNNSNSLLANPCSGYTGQGTQLTSYGQDTLAQLSAYASGQLEDAPPEAVAAGYYINTYSVSNFTPANVDTTNSRVAGFKLYANNLFGSTPPLTDFQFNADGSLTLKGNSAQPNSEVVTASPTSKANSAYHGTAFGGGGLFEATLTFAGGSWSTSASDGWPSFWAEPLETAVLYGVAGTDQWAGQVAGYHHGVEMDIMEYEAASMNAALHESWGLYGSTCPPQYCQYSSNLQPHFTLPSDFTRSHRYGWRWTVATATSPGKAEFFVDGVLQNSQSWTQFTTQQPPPTGQPWAFGAVDTFHYVLILGTGSGVPMTLYALNVWQKDASQLKVN